MAGDGEDGDRRNVEILRKGVVMRSVYEEYKLEIVIGMGFFFHCRSDLTFKLMCVYDLRGFMGIDVPYVAEGLRYELPIHLHDGLICWNFQWE